MTDRTMTKEPGIYTITSDTGKELDLVMQQLLLTGRIMPVGTVLNVRHIFRPALERPAEAVYCFPLPRDGALRKFTILTESHTVTSELKEVNDAVRTYEKGIEEGSLSALAKCYRDGLVNLSVGNIRPEETVTVCLEILCGLETRDNEFRFRYPFTLAPSYHRKMRVVEVKPARGEMGLPEAEFGDIILPEWHAEANELHQIGCHLEIYLPTETGEITSPSHQIVTAPGRKGSMRVSLAGDGDVPNRDLVLDVPMSETEQFTQGATNDEGKGRFIAVIPSSRFASGGTGPSRIVFVLDRSGSMRGAPIEQAKRSLEACLGALSEDDSFGIVAFDHETECFDRELSQAVTEVRDEAGIFIDGIHARGGTELGAAVRKGILMLGGEGGDILLLTDGQVLGTEDILQENEHRRFRIHCLGIGSASQDRFLELLARSNGGISRFVTPRERVDMAAMRLFSSIRKPVAEDVKVRFDGELGGQINPIPARTVFEGRPLVVFGKTEKDSGVCLEIEWTGSEAPASLHVPVPLADPGLYETIRLLQGARLITDLEARMTVAEPGNLESLDSTEQSRFRDLMKLSKEYGLASRCMALVAVVKREDDRAGDIPETRVVPVGMPESEHWGAYFRPTALSRSSGEKYSGMLSEKSTLCSVREPDVKFCLADPDDEYPRTEKAPSSFILRTIDRVSEILGRGRRDEAGAGGTKKTKPDQMEDSAADALLKLAAAIQEDGGLPGDDEEERILFSAAGILAFMGEGYTPETGTFSRHITRLIEFLKAKTKSYVLEENKQETLQALTAAIPKERSIFAGNWLHLAAQILDSGMSGRKQEIWQNIERVVDLGPENSSP